MPFKLRKPRYNAETEAAMKEAREIIGGKNKAKVYKTVAEMNADIDGDEE
jgi:DNA-damage-inducible protein J